jgi:hypothetical protein
MGTQAYTKLDRHVMAMDSTWAEHHVSENKKINNLVVFNLPPESPASFPTTAAAKPRDTAEETDKDGNTLFHLEPRINKMNRREWLHNWKWLRDCILRGS